MVEGEDEILFPLPFRVLGPGPVTKDKLTRKKSKRRVLAFIYIQENPENE